METNKMSWKILRNQLILVRPIIIATKKKKKACDNDFVFWPECLIQTGQSIQEEAAINTKRGWNQSSSK